MGFLLLGVDSLIACLAIGPIISKRWFAPFAVLFGLCDVGGFLLGSAFHWSISGSASATAQTSILVALGVYWLAIAVLGKTARAAASRSRGLMWILPLVLTIDNITFGLAGDGAGSLLRQSGEQFVSSVLLAGVGLAIGLAVAQAIPAVRRHAAVANGFAGGALVLASGALLMWG